MAKSVFRLRIEVSQDDSPAAKTARTIIRLVSGHTFARRPPQGAAHVRECKIASRRNRVRRRRFGIERRPQTRRKAPPDEVSPFFRVFAKSCGLCSTVLAD